MKVDHPPSFIFLSVWTYHGRTLNSAVGRKGQHSPFYILGSPGFHSVPTNANLNITLE